MARTDEDIEKDVVDHLCSDGRVNTVKLNVQVKEGRVALTGSVPTYFAKQCALNDALSVRGVIGVTDHTIVRLLQNIPPPSDSQIQSYVETALNWIPDIDTSQVEVSVKGGVVTVEGCVDEYWKKPHVEALISRLGPVVDIDNRLAVVPSQDFEDQSIAENVIAALDRYTLTDVRKINVTVENGIVTFSGTVVSRAAVLAADDAAFYAGGVRGIRNNLVVLC